MPRSSPGLAVPRQGFPPWVPIAEPRTFPREIIIPLASPNCHRLGSSKCESCSAFLRRVSLKVVGGGFKTYIYTLTDSHIDIHKDACHTNHTVSDHGNNSGVQRSGFLPQQVISLLNLGFLICEGG